MKAFMVAAPHSGSGKTVVTLGLLRAMRNLGLDVGSAKAGPDYIDSAFHTAATGRECVNLDPWAMRSALIEALALHRLAKGDCAIVEAMMGLFDGAADGTGSAGDLAKALNLPVVLVVDASRMAHSVAALVSGYRAHDREVRIAGVILNRVGSVRHEGMLRSALEAVDLRVLGAIPASDTLSLPSRHLGLVQARENANLEAFIEAAAAHVAAHCDLDALLALTMDMPKKTQPRFLPPLGNRMAIARDDAFAFLYPHLLEGWKQAGAEQITFFSPLADEGPDEGCDAVYLPGGYPELHAGRIASSAGFKTGLKKAVEKGALVYGECGGFMVLGDGLIDAQGVRHEMTGHLPLVTSFAERKRHLGYRQLTPLAGSPWQMKLRGHEFHYSSVVSEGSSERLFAARDAEGAELGDMGLRRGNVFGSYMHVIDRAD